MVSRFCKAAFRYLLKENWLRIEFGCYLAYFYFEPVSYIKHSLILKVTDYSL